jgi:hypothetical protein
LFGKFCGGFNQVKKSVLNPENFKTAATVKTEGFKSVVVASMSFTV